MDAPLLTIHNEELYVKNARGWLTETSPINFEWHGPKNQLPDYIVLSGLLKEPFTAIRYRPENFDLETGRGSFHLDRPVEELPSSGIPLKNTRDKRLRFEFVLNGQKFHARFNEFQIISNKSARTAASPPSQGQMPAATPNMFQANPENITWGGAGPLQDMMGYNVQFPQGLNPAAEPADPMTLDFPMNSDAFLPMSPAPLDVTNMPNMAPQVAAPPVNLTELSAALGIQDLADKMEAIKNEVQQHATVNQMNHQMLEARIQGVEHYTGTLLENAIYDLKPEELCLTLYALARIRELNHDDVSNQFATCFEINDQLTNDLEDEPHDLPLSRFTLCCMRLLQLNLVEQNPQLRSYRIIEAGSDHLRRNGELLPESVRAAYSPGIREMSSPISPASPGFFNPTFQD
eukprot:TRINITY_DN12781_c0_g1::TRINITY_DN12781_c0_g1_i1::g.28649::m.28649 TRINITY_DN12781_c0_g1::TRINITY_DN12781_c0_g1_i1::g.28649  ORF type:complete len:404 (+),score=13.25 TRINITY_DN12781_c0_g1_i1:111-1322(+)